VTFQESIKACFGKYATFSGRASRSEFWWWVLFLLLATAAAGMVNDKLAGLVSLAALLPNLAVTARRLHDIDRSGWWFLILFLPFVGFFIFVWLAAKAGSPGENRYGPVPPAEV